MRRSLKTGLLLDFAYGFECAFAGRSTGTKSHRKKPGLELRQFIPGSAKLGGTLFIFRRAKFEAIDSRVFFL